MAAHQNDAGTFLATFHETACRACRPQVKRPTTCGALAAVSPDLGEIGCKRLPRHGGEHRAFRTLAEGRRAERDAARSDGSSKPAAKRGPKGKGRKVTIAGRRAIIRTLRVEAGAAERGRVTRAQRRTMLASLAVQVEGHTLNANDALGIAALI